MGLTLLALLAVVAPSAWLRLWRGGVLGMAVLAPLLASARAARAVRGHAVEAEFDRWFRPDTTGVSGAPGRFPRRGRRPSPALRAPSPGERVMELGERSGVPKLTTWSRFPKVRHSIGTECDGVRREGREP